MSLLRVLTLNTWMLRLPVGIDLAQDIDERSLLIPFEIAKLNPDVIILQEVWDGKIRKKWKRMFQEFGFDYCAEKFDALVPRPGSPVEDELPLTYPPKIAPYIYEQQIHESLRQGYGGIGVVALAFGKTIIEHFRRNMGNGLQIYSRFPLNDKIDQLVFSTHTRADERLVPKGAIRTQVSHPQFGLIDIYNSHFGAVTFDEKKGCFITDELIRRKKQVLEFSAWVNETRQSESSIIGCDLNVHPFDFGENGYQTNYSFEYDMITKGFGGLNFIDSFAYINGLNAKKSFTDSKENSYKTTGVFKKSPDATLDYIFVDRDSQLIPSSSEVVFTNQISKTLGQGQLYLSDHFGVTTDFQIAYK